MLANPSIFASRIPLPRFGAKPKTPDSGFYRFQEGTSAEKESEQERLKALFDPMIGRVSESEYESVDYYTSNAVELNGSQRILGDSPFAPTGEERQRILAIYQAYKQRFDQFMADLDRLIFRGRLPFDATVFRGIRSGIQLKDLSKGQTITEPGYLSTSPFLDTARESFSQAFKRDGTGNFVFRIKVPKGTPCLNPDTVLTHHRLNELLFPRNGQLKIEKIGRERGLSIVDAKLSY